MKQKKEQGFRRKVISWLIIAFFYAVGILVFFLWLIVEGVRVWLYLPEILIAFIVALCRDRWQMWFSPWLEEYIAKPLWDMSQNIFHNFGDLAKDIA